MPVTHPVRVVRFRMPLEMSSLNIEEGYPSLTIPSRNISNLQVQIFGEVTVE